METSRTKNVIKNIWFTLISQALNIFLSFFSRSIFLKFLGIEYLGINGLFTNVLMLLSFAELGIGNAIIFSMYKPVALNDTEKIKSLMNLYEKAYRIIGGVIIIVGLSLIPFLNTFIKETPDIKENLVLIYLLFLLNTVSSYFYVYKKSLIIANQKNYLVSIYQQVFHMFQVVLQILFLYTTNEYIVFLIIQIVIGIANNIAISIKANKMYPYLKEKDIQKLDKNESKDIARNVKSLFLYKLGSVILNGTDNIIVSSLFGVSLVGLTSNFLLIINTISSISNQVMGSFTSSIGNLNAIGDIDNKERVFKRIFFISCWMFGYFSIGLYFLLNPFIVIWIGAKYTLSNLVILSLVLHFYINNVHFSAYTYRTTLGLFVKGKYAPLAAAIINIVLSVIMGKAFGLAGVFFATSISRILTTGIVDPVLVYKNGFNKNPIIYFFRYVRMLLINIGVALLIGYLLPYIRLQGVIGFLIKGLFITLLYNIAMIIIYRKSQDYIELKRIILRRNKKDIEVY